MKAKIKNIQSRADGTEIILTIHKEEWRTAKGFFPLTDVEVKVSKINMKK